MSTNIKVKSSQDTEDMKANLINTIKEQLKDQLKYRTMNIKGLIGITLDDHEVFMIDIEEVIRNEVFHRPSLRRRKSTNVTKLKAAEINSRLHTSDGEEVHEEDDDSLSSKYRRLEDGSSSGRSSVETQSDSCASSSVPQPQRFVQNTELWCPESDTSNNLSNGTIVVEPSAAYEDQASQNSQTNPNGHEETTTSNHENAATNLPSTEPRSSNQVQSSDNPKSNLNILENALHEPGLKQDNGPSTPEVNDEPINLSRSVSRDKEDTPQDLVVKKEPEEQKPPMSLPLPFYPPGNGSDSDFHTTWLRNMAGKNDRIAVPQSLPMMVNHMQVDGMQFPSPMLLDPQMSLDSLKRPLLPNTTNPFVLNTPQLHPPNNIKKRSRKALNQAEQSCASYPVQSTSKIVTGQKCGNCGADQTSAWRRSSSGELVCNACGLYYKLHKVATTTTAAVTPRGPSSRHSSSSSSSMGNRCSNCSTHTTTMWRRNMDGEPVCNACGLYYKLHQVNRPKSMMKQEIHSRKRKPRRNNTQMARENASNTAQKESGSRPQELPRIAPYMPVDLPLNSASLLAVSAANALSIAAAVSPSLLTTSQALLPGAYSPTTPNTNTTTSTPGTSLPTTPTGPITSNGPGSMNGDPGPSFSPQPSTPNGPAAAASSSLSPEDSKPELS